METKCRYGAQWPGRRTGAWASWESSPPRTRRSGWRTRGDGRVLGTMVKFASWDSVTNVPTATADHTATNTAMVRDREEDEATRTVDSVSTRRAES